jgi:hypothetical protein
MERSPGLVGPIEGIKFGIRQPDWGADCALAVAANNKAAAKTPQSCKLRQTFMA